MLREGAVGGGRRVPQGVGHDVGVKVGRDGQLGVAQHLHDHAGWDVLREEEGRAGVPEVVEPDSSTPARRVSSSNSRVRLRRSITVLTVEVKTSPESVHLGLAANASLAWIARWRRSAFNDASGKGMVRREREDFGGL